MIENKYAGTAFGTTKAGREVRLFTLKNRNGLELRVINYGGIVVSLKAPDRNGNFADVVLGYDSLEAYEDNNPYYGALIGRYGNRIKEGKFKLDGREFNLPINNGPNHLHGGDGYHTVFWEITQHDSSSLTLTYHSADGEQGYPGNLDIEVIYSLNDSNEFNIQYKAVTDQPTIVNLTQHSYFNLKGHDQGDILDHELEIKATRFLPVDQTLIPTGTFAEVKGTPFDFTSPRRIGSAIDQEDRQLELGKGYDHCWILDNSDGSLKLVATLREPKSGRRVDVLTTEPGLQFYSGNFLDGKNIGKGGHAYQFRFGLCLETQHFPDSPNRASFPSVVLRPGETYRTTTAYRFSTEK